MSSEQFLTANNKLLEKKYVAESQIESKIKAKIVEKRFLKYLLAKMFYLTQSFSDIKLLCCYRDLVKWSLSKCSFENIQNTFLKSLCEILKKKQYV